jgi:hypothetical protein
MSGSCYLLLRRGGGTWALPESSVGAIRGCPTGFTVAAGSVELLADEVLGVARDLTVRAPGPLLERLWPTRCTGLAVHAGTPVVVIDPDSPPPALRREGALTHDH